MSCSCFGSSSVLQKKRDKHAHEPKQDEEGKLCYCSIYSFEESCQPHVLIFAFWCSVCGDWFECFAYFSYDIKLPVILLLFCYISYVCLLHPGPYIAKTKNFSYNELKVATNNFHRSNKIGRGGFGTVYKVSRHRIILSAFIIYLLFLLNSFPKW